ncbi:hypothetical protein VF14_02895 [Nostoc linckia z18]|uniref:Uncharacterized protein n=2 Tax=Nostoc linckia TaxID=92942 RepID=A0A9Q6ENG1_NOSLI|nr:hypothetical protein VF02_00365 [Nostoc linckia z1]PHJ73254.1 hypothetical protein VF05_01380 [Nostoc linckia z3]PHJ78601.1 hypothetical protein VF03_00365 [Nostoc linckia z2]PHJ85705.1 hypothetical protein VF06_05685 [Nostoc linckia z4]PHJ92207.1 hypothetical protein VF07_01670 [Nostoc linckia z6]PHK01211.1 hypothetical protein VF04_00365 [Nostoc linckia z7]PHK07314.1 hypothetical protein VF08_01585 [Nostoc linckia z8]PHK13051.1 hypothetical protein VF09_01670 [Nostoc linckia z9]PHK1511
MGHWAWGIGHGALGMGKVKRGKDEKIFHWDCSRAFCLLPSMGIIVNVLCVKQVGKNEIRNI